MSSTVAFSCRASVCTEQKKERHMHFSIHFSKSTFFVDIARYVYYVTYIRLPDALTSFFHFNQLPKSWPT